MQTGKQGKQSTSVPHVSQPNSTQATIALVVSNCIHAKLKNQQTQTCKTSKSSSSNYCLSPTHLPTCQQLKSLHSHFSWVMTPYYSNCKHNFQVLSVSWPRSSFPFGRISVLERKRLRASISSPQTQATTSASMKTVRRLDFLGKEVAIRKVGQAALDSKAPAVKTSLPRTNISHTQET